MGSDEQRSKRRSVEQPNDKTDEVSLSNPNSNSKPSDRIRIRITTRPIHQNQNQISGEISDKYTRFSFSSSKEPGGLAPGLKIRFRGKLLTSTVSFLFFQENRRAWLVGWLTSPPSVLFFSFSFLVSFFLLFCLFLLCFVSFEGGFEVEFEGGA